MPVKNVSTTDSRAKLLSTVSKVLRLKDKYLHKQIEAVHSPERRTKGRSPDIEKTLSNWAIKEQRKGTVLSDEMIRVKARYFSSVSGTDSTACSPADDAAWLETFKRKYNIPSRKPTMDPSASNGTSDPSRTAFGHQTPDERSPTMPANETSPSRKELCHVRSEGSLKAESPDDLGDLKMTLSANSHSVVFAESSSSSFSPNPLLSPTSPLFDPDTMGSPRLRPFFHGSGTAAASPSGSSSFQRPRSQTFPMIFQPHEALTDVTVYLSEDSVDSAMEDSGRPRSSIDEAIGIGDSHGVSMDLDMTQPQTVSPAQMMRHQSVPSSVSNSVYQGHYGVGAPMTEPGPMVAHVASPHQQRETLPSQDDARHAMQVIWQYFSGQPQGMDRGLNMEETAMMGRIMERLKPRDGNR